MGYESVGTFRNIKGGILQTIEFFIIGLFVTFALRYISMAKRVYARLTEIFIFSFILRAFIEGYLENSIYVMLGLFNEPA